MILPVLQSLANLASEKLASNASLLKSGTVDIGPAIPNEPIVPFEAGGMGNFPFYWQNGQGQFNYDTYSWINTNLQNGSFPLQQQLGSLFTNLFAEVFSCVSFSLSSADTNLLSAQSGQLVSLQQQIIVQWNASCTPKSNNFDDTISLICQNWASPPIATNQLLSSTNVLSTLNSIPPNGMLLVPNLVSYISISRSVEALAGQVPKNNGELECVKTALQHPTLQNGGMQASDSLMYPAFEVLSSVQDIIRELEASSILTFQIMIEGDGAENVTVTGSSFAPFTSPLNDIIKLVVDGFEEELGNLLSSMQDSLKVTMNFKGITKVVFSPCPYNVEQNKNWYWTEPIVEAMRNGVADVTGFKFMPVPSVDFSKNGPFAFLTAVVISNFPEVNLSFNHPNRQQVADAIEKASSATVTLFGNSFSTSCSSSTIADDGIYITLTPPMPVAYNLNSRAWIHGACACFPASF